MPQRNTNVDSLLFPVKLEPIYLQKDSTPIKGFQAIAGYPYSPDEKTVFTVVTNNYELISNESAISIANAVYRNVFKSISTADLEIFNLIYPRTKSFCHIDIIHKQYKVNVWEQEIYVPFIRITNSYNRTKKLTFELGFSRKLCDNGVIFEKETITFSYTHTKGILNIGLIEQQLGNSDRLLRLEKSFAGWMQQLQSYPVDDKYMLPLCAKIFNLQFDIETKDWERRKNETNRLVEFQQRMTYLKQKYSLDMGQTAYTVYNMATDYATHMTQTLYINQRQTQAGTWLSSFCEAVATKPFSMDTYLKGYESLVG